MMTVRVATDEEVFRAKCAEVAKELSSAIDDLVENPDETDGIKTLLRTRDRSLQHYIDRVSDKGSVEDLWGLLSLVLKTYRTPLLSALGVIEHYEELSDIKQ